MYEICLISKYLRTDDGSNLSERRIPVGAEGIIYPGLNRKRYPNLFLEIDFVFQNYTCVHYFKICHSVLW